MSKPILVLDFDGTLHSYTSGWQGAEVIPDPPVPGSLQFIKDALEYFDVQIYSSRSNQLGGILAMREWLLYWLSREFPEEARSIYNQIKWPTTKPAAFLTIDDRAYTFEGEWPPIRDLLDFKPWNKR